MNIPLDQWNGSKQVTVKLDQIQNENKSRERLMLWLAAIVAVAAVIAAWPVVKEWF